MGATCYLLVRQAPGSWQGIAMIAASVLLLSLTRVAPVVLIVGAGLVGAGLSW
jgi:hypothetical protein